MEYPEYFYKADMTKEDQKEYSCLFQSPVTMPKAAVRWEFECIDIKVFKVSEHKSINEDYHCQAAENKVFEQWWDETYPKHPFDKAWAWGITFKR